MSDDRPQNIKDEYPLRYTGNEECVCWHNYKEHNGESVLDQPCSVCVCRSFSIK